MQEATVVTEFTRQAESFNASAVARDAEMQDWLQRGSGGPGARALIERALGQRPPRAGCFAVLPAADGRVLELSLWIGRWRR